MKSKSRFVNPHGGGYRKHTQTHRDRSKYDRNDHKIETQFIIKYKNMKIYYYIAGYYKGNQISVIDSDGKDDYNLEVFDHSNAKTFENREEASKFADKLRRSNNTRAGFEYFVEVYDLGSIFLVDTWNGNKVIGEFESGFEVNEYLDKKEFMEDWENVAETFEDYYEGFVWVEWMDMYEAWCKHGSRVLNYWT